MGIIMVLSFDSERRLFTQALGLHPALWFPLATCVGQASPEPVGEVGNGRREGERKRKRGRESTTDYFYGAWLTHLWGRQV